jgi:hypothetical protein
MTTTLDFTLTSTMGTFTGHVWTASNVPIAGALVTFSPGGLTATTDPNGLYTKAVQPGTYTLTASAVDYLQQTVSGLTVAQGAAKMQDFRLLPVVYTMAAYDSNLKAPRCNAGSACNSGILLIGRDNVSGGIEPNQPNTINNSCADGTSGSFHSDESIDVLKVSTLDGSPFTIGKAVRLDVSVWLYGPTDQLDLYYASDAASPNWTFLATLTPPGPTQSLNKLSTTYVLPSGNLHAVRANFRYGGTAAACTTGGYDDHDDLIFGVLAAAKKVRAQTTSQ